ncbi:MAG: glucose-1-phosphate adenylyltransferase subunit GlgD [Clostridiales bacterium]|jgi:glucose-1-phosphate adenylyltransferase|nr:glucose-1-phosphate adenylyltransferase subunit GlgD [Clostridiales bacterium]
MRAVGIILAGGNNDRLGNLTMFRATSAMPVGSCYRAIDFPLSNMSNSGINKVAVITQYNSRSLHDHLSSAKWWDLGRKQGGLFIFTPYLTSDNSFWFRGTADSMYQNISFLKRSNEQYVVITSGHTVYKMDYDDVIDAHIKKGADITIVSRKRMEDEDLKSYGVMSDDEDGRITDFEEKPLEPQYDTLSLGIYVIARSLLIHLLESVVPEGRYDFVRDVLQRYRKKLKMYSYNFDGYCKAVNSIQSYFELNMDFLNREIRENLTKKEPYIETKPKDEPPVKFNYGSVFKDSLVGNGSILNGVVEHSVLFRKVVTGENSVILNSIIMEGCYIGDNCRVENAILDKEVILSDGKQLIGERFNPVIVGKREVV